LADVPQLLQNFDSTDKSWWYSHSVNSENKKHRSRMFRNIKLTKTAHGSGINECML